MRFLAPLFVLMTLAGCGAMDSTCSTLSVACFVVDDVAKWQVEAHVAELLVVDGQVVVLGRLDNGTNRVLVLDGPTGTEQAEVALEGGSSNELPLWTSTIGPPSVEAVMHEGVLWVGQTHYGSSWLDGFRWPLPAKGDVSDATYSYDVPNETHRISLSEGTYLSPERRSLAVQSMKYLDSGDKEATVEFLSLGASGLALEQANVFSSSFAWTSADTDGDGLQELIHHEGIFDPVDDTQAPPVKNGAVYRVGGDVTGSGADTVARSYGARSDLGYFADNGFVRKVDFQGKALATGDFNGDGQPDLLLSNYIESEEADGVLIFLGPVSGSLRTSNADVVILGKEYDALGSFHAAVADLDGDGLDDLVLPSGGDGLVRMVPGASLGL